MKEIAVLKLGILGKLYASNWIAVMLINSIVTAGAPIHELCGDSGEVSSREGAFGTIKYTNTCNSDVTSSITIQRPTGSAHRYAVLEGVASKSDTLPCQTNSGMLNVTSTPICIESQQFYVLAFHQLPEPLTITSTGIKQPFTIKYYTTGKCLRMTNVGTLLKNYQICVTKKWAH